MASESRDCWVVVAPTKLLWATLQTWDQNETGIGFVLDEWHMSGVSCVPAPR